VNHGDFYYLLANLNHALLVLLYNCYYKHHHTIVNNSTACTQLYQHLQAMPSTVAALQMASLLVIGKHLLLLLLLVSVDYHGKYMPDSLVFSSS
jgi:hypothetical protein